MALLAITAKKLFTPREIIKEGLVVIEEGVIRSVGSREELTVPAAARLVDLGERILAPGFVDVHIHGGGGHDVMEATREALETVAAMVLRHGTTCFVPTTLTAAPPVLSKSLEGLGSLIRSWKNRKAKTPVPGGLLAEPVGIHLEGPFLSAECRGAHPPGDLQAPSLPLFQQLQEAAGGCLRILTLAPELEGATELQAAAIRSGVRVGLGHSNATFRQTETAIAAGASHAVHVFNTMRRFEHRETGILGAVLTDDRVQAEVIADGVHVSAPALRLLVRAKGTANILLITDGVSATGMGPGQYRLGEMEIRVEDDPRTGLPACRNTEGRLAGSVLTQDRAIRNMVDFTDVTLCEAVRMATLNPARALGMEHRKGCLQPGADADIVVLEPDGTVAGVMARGIGNFL